MATFENCTVCGERFLSKSAIHRFCKRACREKAADVRRRENKEGCRLSTNYIEDESGPAPAPHPYCDDDRDAEESYGEECDKITDTLFKDVIESLELT